jgi:glycosyltransferase involved in cell wall biosynthesis
MSSVLHIVQTPLDHVGGPATYVRELSKGLVKKGVKVGIVAPISRNTKEIMELRELGIEIYSVNNNPLPTSFLRAPWIFSIKAHRTIRNALSEYDVVNIHVESTFLQIVMGDFKDKKLMATIHGFPLYEDLESLKSNFNIYKILHLALIAPQHILTLSKLINDSKLIISLSNQLKNTLIELFGIDNKKLITIPNGVDTGFFRPIDPDIARSIVQKLISRRCGVDIRSDLILLYLARVEPRKGTDVLVRAVSRLSRRDWYLLIVGSIEQPNYARYVSELAEKLGVRGKICITGSIPRSMLPVLYSASYMYILPSLFEGLPASILEAMSCKTSVIASNVGGVPEVVINRYNGILFNPGSVEELSKAIEYVLESPKTRETLATRAYLTSQLYSWKYIAEKYYTMLFSIAH